LSFDVADSCPHSVSSSVAWACWVEQKALGSLPLHLLAPLPIVSASIAVSVDG
jgi:hypothetical protein